MRSSDWQIKQLTWHEALDKLGSVSVGRVLFTRRGLPTIRFVNHILDHGMVVIRDHGADVAAVRTGGHALIIGYETDEIDSSTRLGWSVTITGSATVVEDLDEAARYRDALRPWVTGGADHIITIDPQSVTGYEIITAGPAGALLPAGRRGNIPGGQPLLTGCMAHTPVRRWQRDRDPQLRRPARGPRGTGGMDPGRWHPGRPSRPAHRAFPPA